MTADDIKNNYEQLKEKCDLFEPATRIIALQLVEIIFQNSIEAYSDREKLHMQGSTYETSNGTIKVNPLDAILNRRENRVMNACVKLAKLFKDVDEVPIDELTAFVSRR